MKKTLFALGFILLFCCTYAQHPVLQTTEWNLVFENDQVKIFTKYSPCEIPAEGFYAEYVLLKAENKTNQALELSWFNDIYYNGKCATCDHGNPEHLQQLALLPNQTATGECGLGFSNGLRVFSKWTKSKNTQTLSKLEISNITVNSKQKP